MSNATVSAGGNCDLVLGRTTWQSRWAVISLQQTTSWKSLRRLDRASPDDLGHVSCMWRGPEMVREGAGSTTRGQPLRSRKGTPQSCSHEELCSPAATSPGRRPELPIKAQPRRTLSWLCDTLDREPRGMSPTPDPRKLRSLSFLRRS